MEKLDEVIIGQGEQSVLTFFTALLNQIKFCTDAFEVHEVIESIAIQVEFDPGFSEASGIEESYSFVLDEELLSGVDASYED